MSNLAAHLYPTVNTLKVLTQSSIRAFRKCPRLYLHTYVSLYRAASTNEAMHFGTLWHNAREVYWATRDIDKAVASIINLDMELDENLDPFVKVRLLAMLGGYHQRWQSVLANYDIIGVEQPFKLDIVNPATKRASRTFSIEGKLDAVVRDEKGLWVVEEKTAKGDLQPDSSYWRRLEIDPQCSTYYAAVQRIYNEVPAGIKYFVNVKPQQRPHMATPIDKRRYTAKGFLDARQREEDETPDGYMIRLAEAIAAAPERFYQMVEVNRLEKDIYESEMDIWDTAQSIQKAQNTNVWLRNPDSCIDIIGQTCKFLPVCTNRASLDDQGLYRKAETPHEELVNATDT